VGTALARLPASTDDDGGRRAVERDTDGHPPASYGDTAVRLTADRVIRHAVFSL
jgi:hypothetical protein